MATSPQLIEPRSTARIDRDARLIAYVGSAIGLVPASGLGLLRSVRGGWPIEPTFVLGDVAFALMYAAPYLLVLVVARTGHGAARGGLLFALGMLSLAATVSTFPGSGITIVLAPATVAIMLAGVWSLRAAEGRMLWAAPYFLVGSLGAAIVIFAFLSMFVLEADRVRCRPLGRGGCLSDTITSSEGAKALGILAFGAAIPIAASRVRVGPNSS